MQTSVLILLLCLVPCIALVAQENMPSREKATFRYYNSFRSGSLFGEDGKGATFSFATEHGLRMGKMSAGVSLGYDNYIRPLVQFGYTNRYVHWRAVPVAATVSVDLFRLFRNTLFFRASAGHSIVWTKRLEESDYEYDASGGFMLSPELGYRINSGKHNLYLSAGYRRQVNRYKYHAVSIWSWPTEPVSVVETMQRVMVTLGFGWN